MLRSSWSTRYCLFLIFLWSIPLQYATHWGTNMCFLVPSEQTWRQGEAPINCDALDGI
jgi:hypothetical protein